MKKMIEWVEIPAVDFKRGVNFYNKVFNLSMEEIDYGTEKMACFPTGEGAVFYKEGYAPSKNGIIVNFNVPDSIEATIARVEANGGKVVLPQTKIEVEGREHFALIIDSEGNTIGLYENL